ncbi:PEP-CTERM sorting domain-containing protein [Massilia sp. LXY-6]|uniref:PEP-CTERM sorting domain-containing protein n=1 Tax=Massilia sp. LXY-6 TaxID=3379823 RepID=UPI003EE323AE
MKISAAIFAALAFATAGAANATLITAQDNFDGVSAGWNGDWTLAAATGKKPAPASITQSGGSTALVFAADANNAAVRNLASVQTTDVFVDFTLQYSGVLGTNDFVALWFGDSNGPNIGLKANCGGDPKQPTCTNDLFVRTSGQGGYFLPGSDLVAGQSYQVFGHLYKSSDKDNAHYDSIDAWFKPTGSDVVSALVTATGNSSIASFDSLGFRSANIDNNVKVTIDNLHVANVPEPGSLMLMGVAFAGFAAARRRRPRG